MELLRKKSEKIISKIIQNQFLVILTDFVSIFEVFLAIGNKKVKLCKKKQSSFSLSLPIFCRPSLGV